MKWGQFMGFMKEIDKNFLVFVGLVGLSDW